MKNNNIRTSVASPSAVGILPLGTILPGGAIHPTIGVIFPAGAIPPARTIFPEGTILPGGAVHPAEGTIFPAGVILPLATTTSVEANPSARIPNFEETATAILRGSTTGTNPSVEANPSARILNFEETATAILRGSPAGTNPSVGANTSAGILHFGGAATISRDSTTGTNPSAEVVPLARIGSIDSALTVTIPSLPPVITAPPVAIVPTAINIEMVSPLMVLDHYLGGKITHKAVKNYFSMKYHGCPSPALCKPDSPDLRHLDTDGITYNGSPIDPVITNALNTFWVFGTPIDARRISKDYACALQHLLEKDQTGLVKLILTIKPHLGTSLIYDKEVYNNGQPVDGYTAYYKHADFIVDGRLPLNKVISTMFHECTHVIAHKIFLQHGTPYFKDSHIPCIYYRESIQKRLLTDPKIKDHSLFHLKDLYKPDDYPGEIIAYFVEHFIQNLTNDAALPSAITFHQSQPLYAWVMGVFMPSVKVFLADPSMKIEDRVQNFEKLVTNFTQHAHKFAPPVPALCVTAPYATPAAEAITPAVVVAAAPASAPVVATPPLVISGALKGSSFPKIMKIDLAQIASSKAFASLFTKSLTPWDSYLLNCGLSPHHDEAGDLALIGGVHESPVE